MSGLLNPPGRICGCEWCDTAAAFSQPGDLERIIRRNGIPDVDPQLDNREESPASATESRLSRPNSTPLGDNSTDVISGAQKAAQLHSTKEATA